MVANRRTVVVAPTLSEAEAEAQGLGIERRDVLLVANACSGRLRGVKVSEDDLVRVREASWSDDLRETLTASLAAGAAA